MRHAQAPDPNAQEEAVHIVIYGNAAMDIYVHPAQQPYLSMPGNPFDVAILAARIERALRDIANSTRGARQQ